MKCTSVRDFAVLFVTGYVGEAGEADDLAGHELLRKPFTVDALASASPPRSARSAAQRIAPRLQQTRQQSMSAARGSASAAARASTTIVRCPAWRLIFQAR